MDFFLRMTFNFFAWKQKKNCEFRDGECMEKLNFFLRERWIFLRMRFNLFACILKKNGELKDGECMERLIFCLRERWILNIPGERTFFYRKIPSIL